jgi:hypothetical protein
MNVNGQELFRLQTINYLPTPQSLFSSINQSSHQLIDIADIILFSLSFKKHIVYKSFGQLNLIELQQFQQFFENISNLSFQYSPTIMNYLVEAWLDCILLRCITLEKSLKTENSHSPFHLQEYQLFFNYLQLCCFTSQEHITTTTTTTTTFPNKSHHLFMILHILISKSKLQFLGFQFLEINVSENQFIKIRCLLWEIIFTIMIHEENQQEQQQQQQQEEVEDYQRIQPIINQLYDHIIIIIQLLSIDEQQQFLRYCIRNWFINYPQQVFFLIQVINIFQCWNLISENETIFFHLLQTMTTRTIVREEDRIAYQLFLQFLQRYLYSNYHLEQQMKLYKIIFDEKIKHFHHSNNEFSSSVTSENHNNMDNLLQISILSKFHWLQYDFETSTITWLFLPTNNQFTAESLWQALDHHYHHHHHHHQQQFQQQNTETTNHHHMNDDWILPGGDMILMILILIINTFQYFQQQKKEIWFIDYFISIIKNHSSSSSSSTRSNPTNIINENSGMLKLFSFFFVITVISKAINTYFISI